MEDHEITLRLRWKQTWADKENDYCAEAPAYQGSVGRIYLFEHGPQQGQWFWAMNAHGPDISRNIGKLSGVASSARKAAREVEDSWVESIKGTVHEQGLSSVAPVNSYAAAKGR
jgi:hypothetical protein